MVRYLGRQRGLLVVGRETYRPVDARGRSWIYAERPSAAESRTQQIGFAGVYIPDAAGAIVQPSQATTLRDH